MTILLRILQVSLLTYILVFEFYYKSSASFLWATLVLMFGFMHAWTSFWGDYQYTNDDLMEASLFVILFSLMYLLVRVIFGRKILLLNQKTFQYKNLKNNSMITDTSLHILFFLFLIVMILKLLPFLNFSGGLLNTSWGGGRAYSTSLSYANSQQLIRIFFYSLSGLIVCYYLKDDKFLFFCSIFILVFNVIITRNRIEVLPIICSLVSIFIFRNKRINIRVVLIGFLSAIAVVYIVYGLRVYRHYGTLNSFINNFDLSDFNNRVISYIETDNGELGLRRAFYYFISKNNDFYGFGELKTYIRMALVYIPTRWSFNLKPEDFAIMMGAATGNAAGISTHPTLFGDCFANAGFLGVFLGIFWGVYCNTVDLITIKQKSIKSAVLVYVINAVVYVIIGRGSVYNGFWFVAFGVPLLIVISYIERHNKYHVRFVFGEK